MVTAYRYTYGDFTFYWDCYRKGSFVARCHSIGEIALLRLSLERGALMRVKHTAILEPLSKAGEIQLYAELLAQCPEGYVRDILSAMQPEVDRAISSDFAFVDFAQRRIENEEHAAAMEAERKELAEITRKVELRRADYNELNAAVNQLRRAVEHIKGIL